MIGPLDRIFEGYLDLRYRIHPVDATFDGRHELDGRYAAYDAESVREHIAAVRSYASALEEAEVDTLADEIDRTAALHDARHLLLVLERERPFAYNPALHLAHALDGVYLLLTRSRDDPAARASALLERLRALPAFLATALDVLAEPSPALAELARGMLPGGVALIAEGLDDPAISWDAVDAAELAEAREEAIRALHRYGDALALMGERPRDTFAIGRDLFDRKLHTAHMIRDNADELLRYAERLRAEALDAAARAAREIAPGEDWRDVLARLRADAPAPDVLLESYRSALDASREFVLANGLMRVPEGALRVQPTPSWLRALVPFAAYQGPGAFESCQDGIFLVTLPTVDGPGRAASRTEIALTAVHEGVPGHHQQIATGNRLDRRIRRVLATPAMREGWAFYAETLMVDSGFPAGPAARLLSAHHVLWRAVRVVLDVSLHTKGMSVDDASTRLRDELAFDDAAARAEALRYCAYPTYQLCYAVGRRDILALREDARRARGSDFSLAAFHDELLSYGALPAALARWGMGLS